MIQLNILRNMPKPGVGGFMSSYGYIKSNYDLLMSEIAGLSEKYGQSVTLVCVTKSGTDEELLALIAAGADNIGENRTGELKRRAQLLSDNGYWPKMHQIGTLQRNKVKYIIDRAALIHSVDSESLALEISKRASAIGRVVPVLIEVNSAGEDAKSGVDFDKAEDLFLKIQNLPGISVQGIMTMGPVCENPEDIRPYFKKTKELFDTLGNKYGYAGEPILSMGMSDSYRVAIEEGATLVRVGRRLFKKN
jgi:pyridoxal phosphate enzyme (YggS family)